MSNDQWTLWAAQRPTDVTLSYRWRIPTRDILGLPLRPEWTDKLHRMGMGYGDAEYWPGCSEWNGFRRMVAAGLEWRLALFDEKDIRWGGLDLLPCPFTGKPPVVIYLGQWIGAPANCPEWLGIESHMVRSTGWTDAAKMRAAWNTRPKAIQ